MSVCPKVAAPDGARSMSDTSDRREDITATVVPNLGGIPPPPRGEFGHLGGGGGGDADFLK